MHKPLFLLTYLAASSFCVACSSDPDPVDLLCPPEGECPTGDDTGVGPDAEDDTGKDADIEEEAPSCETFCEEDPLYVESNDGRYSLTRAAYGLSSPERTESAEWEIYVEVWEGGFTGCPDEASPTPARSAILSGLPLFDDTALVEDDRLSFTLFDYQGDVIDWESPFLRASAVSVLPLRWELCLECVGEAPPSHPEGEIALRVEATVENLEVRGEIVARHCDSLDLP